MEERRQWTPVTRRQRPAHAQQPSSPGGSSIQRLRLLMTRDVPRNLGTCLEEVTYMDIMLWTAMMIIFVCFFVWMGIKLGIHAPSYPAAAALRSGIKI